MPSDVRHQVDGGRAYPVVRLTGVLDAGTASSVRSWLLDLLAGQPEAIVVDVRELTVGDPAALAVLGEVARDAAGWPGSHLVLTTGSDGAAWRTAGLPVWPTPEQAIAALGAPEPHRFLHASLEPVTGTARRSRELVTEACGRWDVPDLAGPACIVVTEMVNNVITHARTPMTVMLARHGDTMSVAVRDRSTQVPHFTGAPVPVTSYGGRGLLLIDSVARSWGSLVLAGGKVVWAVLDPYDQQASNSPAQAWGAGLAGSQQGMRDNDYPTEVSDPEASGLPDTADDDSNAYDSVESTRWADGADPAALPGVGPGGSNRYGDTAEEARQGEPLDYRLRQEEPDVGAEDPLPVDRDPVDETVDSSDQRQFDADVWGASPTSDPNSAVSLYDDGQLDADSPQPVGRIVETDEGYGNDDEADSIAYDAGAAGGGASAEELAMHETPAPDYR